MRTNRAIRQVPFFFVIREREEVQKEIVPSCYKSKIFRISCALALVLSLSFVLSVRVLVLKSSYEVQALKDTIVANENKLIRLDYRYAALIQPSELRQRASHELNMVTPSPNLVTVVYR